MEERSLLSERPTYISFPDVFTVLFLYIFYGVICRTMSSKVETKQLFYLPLNISYK